MDKITTLLLFVCSIKVSLENMNLVTVVQKVMKAQIQCYSPGTVSRHWWICSGCHPMRVLKMTAANPCV